MNLEKDDYALLQPLAEGICAAYVSTQMGLRSIDYVLKKYVRTIGEPPADAWFQIAAFVSEVMRQAKPLPETGPANEGAALEITVPNRKKGAHRKPSNKETRKEN